MAAIEGGVASWRFHPRDAGWPLVRRGPRIAAKSSRDRPIRRVTAATDDREAFFLALDGRDIALRGAGSRNGLADGVHTLNVHAEDEASRSGSETVGFLADCVGVTDRPAAMPTAVTGTPSALGRKSTCSACGSSPTATDMNGEY